MNMLTADVWNSVDFTPHVLQSTGAELRKYLKYFSLNTRQTRYVMFEQTGDEKLVHK